MGKYRKKPVVIDAVRWDGTEQTFLNIVLPFLTDGHNDFDHLPNWGGYKKPGIGVCGGEITIPTLEGNMQARPGDWIIKGVKGEFYPCKPDIFDATYEAVEQQQNHAEVAIKAYAERQAQCCGNCYNEIKTEYAVTQCREVYGLFPPKFGCKFWKPKEEKCKE